MCAISRRLRRISRARFFPADDFGPAVTPSSRSRWADQADTGRRVVLRVNRDIYFASSPPLWLRPFSHLLRRFRRTCRVCVRCVAHTFAGAYTRIRRVQREPTQLRHNPPVFALAWHGTASLFGHFRPGQAPPTFILITSWFAPGFCSPSFFPSERFPTADAWEPHLCPLAYSCPGPCDADLDVSFSSSVFPLSSPSRCRSRGNTGTMLYDVTLQG